MIGRGEFASGCVAEESSTTFTITATPVTAPTAVTVTANYGGVVQRAVVVVAPENAVTIRSLAISPDRVAGGTPSIGVVTLTGAAPFGGAVVTLDVRRRNIVAVPTTVTVPQGATSTIFPIGTQPVHGNKDRAAEIVATYNGVSSTATFTVTPAATASTSPFTSTQPVALCASSALEPCLTQTALRIATASSTTFDRQYNLYTPELTLLAETAPTSGAAPPIAYEYIWFAGQPLAQVSVAANETHYYLNDHLGTPILQTDATAQAIWRAEYDPYGKVQLMRRGEAKHQPLRFPGQEGDESGELRYNVFRWYRAGWGRYTQSDPLGVTEALNVFSYAVGNPISFIDEYGLRARLPQPGPPPTEICPFPQQTPGRPEWGGRVGAIMILLDVLFTPGELNPIEFENQRPYCNPCYEAAGKKKGGWICRASCNTTIFDRQPDITYPDRLYGDGVGSTETEACQAANTAATSSAPRGAYGRHCQCRCRKL